MKPYAALVSLLLITACSSTPKLAQNDPAPIRDENDQLCENHKSDYQYFRAAFDKEHAEACTGGCVYTPTMNKNSDTLQRVAGLYYLMGCDANHGRL